jgi:hypothetical protein
MHREIRPILFLTVRYDFELTREEQSQDTQRVTRGREYKNDRQKIRGPKDKQ